MGGVDWGGVGFAAVGEGEGCADRGVHWLHLPVVVPLWKQEINNNMNYILHYLSLSLVLFSVKLHFFKHLFVLDFMCVCPN